MKSRYIVGLLMVTGLSASAADLPIGYVCQSELTVALEGTRVPAFTALVKGLDSSSPKVELKSADLYSRHSVQIQVQPQGNDQLLAVGNKSFAMYTGPISREPNQANLVLTFTELQKLVERSWAQGYEQIGVDPQDKEVDAIAMNCRVAKVEW